MLTRNREPAAGRQVASVVALLCAAALLGCSAIVPATAGPSPSTSTEASVAPSGSPVVTPGPSPTTSPTGTPTIAPIPPIATTTPPASPTATTAPTTRPSPTAGPDGWIGPEPVVSAGYDELDMALDADGFVHVAAVRNNRIHYLTNRSGEWTRERVTTPSGRDGQPSIALDTDGSVWIAFTRWEREDPDYCGDLSDCYGPPPLGIFYVTGGATGWTVAARLAAPASNGPSLAVRDGKVHLAYLTREVVGELSGPGPVHYMTNSSGSWTDEPVGMAYGAPELRLGHDGRAHLAYWDTDFESTHDVRIWYASAQAAGGGFAPELVFWGHLALPDAVWVNPVLLALGGDDRAHLAAEVWTEESPVRYHWTTQGTGWGQAVDPIATTPRALDADDTNAIHLLGSGGWPCQCLAYVTNRSGSYGTRELAPSGTAHDLSLDRQSRPHILFSTGSGADRTLWYAVGPGG